MTPKRRDDPQAQMSTAEVMQAQMSTAEVMTVTLVAAAVFDGNQEKSRRFLQEHGYIKAMLSKSRFNRKAMLSKSRFNRRWHAIPEALLARHPGGTLAGAAVAARRSRQTRQPGRGL